ncbi:MAG: pectate lyase [Rikenellaceae bacterium]|jgi:PelA/Pel-15E family pectate lyase|nr:pectate lyase [Rikenellaceae bacterium]
MKTRMNAWPALWAWALALSFPPGASAQKNAKIDDDILRAVKQATGYMVNTVSYNGAFVWEYLPDFSRQWGEMEAYRTMGWTQGQGTPAMGEFFLDLYHATGDEFYYAAAEKAAMALIWGQLPCGGWNYIFDFAGEASLKRWYGTIGKNGWRLEEFQHYYGNATYDDGASITPARFLLRMYVEKYDSKFRPAIDRAINFVLESQYPIGGWPQRYPLMYEYSKQGRDDYSSYITFNDQVHDNCVNFLILCYQMLGERRLLDPIRRAMNCTLVLQQGPDQPGWGDQYTLDYKPAGARSYEPLSIHPRTTDWCCNSLMDYYELTGETKYLARIPEAIAWLELVAAPMDTVRALGFTRFSGTQVSAPRYIEVGTNKPLASVRTGSNAISGRYTTKQMYSSDMIRIDIERIKRRYQHLTSTPVEEVTRLSPLRNEGGQAYQMPEYLQMRPGRTDEKEVRELLASLTPEGYWLVPIGMTSNPYIGDGPLEPTPGNFRGQVGDKYDTSPFTPKDPIQGITTASYMTNVGKLIGFLNNR